MSIFKRGADIDFTLMHKKGIIKVPERKGLGNVRVNSQGLVDFTGASSDVTSSSSTGSSSSSDSSSTQSVSPFGFLDSLATSSSSSSSSSGLENSMRSPDMELNALKIKVDDLDFKIGQLVEKLSIIEMKLGSFENRIG